MSHTSITGVYTVGINVKDQDAALAFFTGLGFEKRIDAPASPTMRWIEVAPPGMTASLAINLATDKTPAGVDTGIRFSVPDAAKEHQLMQDVGVEVGELLEWDGVPPMFTFDDPDGNRFYVVEDQT